MRRSDLLDIEPTGTVLHGVPEGHCRILAVDQKHFRDIRFRERPSLFLGVFPEIRKSDLLGIHTDAFADGFLHRENDLLRLGRREIERAGEVFAESGHCTKNEE